MTGPLSEYFTWTEVWHSETAERAGIDNTPPEHLHFAIERTARQMDRVRRLLGRPVLVSSWYRSPALNARVGSRDTSQHLLGVAVDFRCPGYGSPTVVWEFLRALRRDLGVDQLILEFPHRPSGGWVHISFAEAPRHMALIIDEGGARFA